MLISSTKTKIDCPKKIALIVSNILSSESDIDRKKEHFWVIGLNANNIIQYIELVSLGTLTNINAANIVTYKLFNHLILNKTLASYVTELNTFILIP